jgi:pyridoxamine 5'-phosphate oxidase
MNLQECLALANKIKDCAVATTENDQPRVRLLGLWFADETGFYFQIWTFKAIYDQLKNNPKMEGCFYSDGIMMRVSGEVEFLGNRELKEKVLQNRPFLKNLGATGPDDPKLIIYRIPHGEISIWARKSGNKVERLPF